MVSAIFKFLRNIHEFEATHNQNEIKTKRDRLYDELTNSDRQFKRKRIESKVQAVKDNYMNQPAPNVYERRTGITLTPLMLGKVQYAKLRAHNNMLQIKQELTLRQVAFQDSENWTTLKNRLRDNELVRTNGDEDARKFFKPLVDYERWVIEN